MSADNYYIIRKDRQGFYVPVMGFASDPHRPIVRARHPRFTELDDALQFALTDYTEYGVSIEEECFTDEPTTLNKIEGKHHYYGCSQSSDDEEFKEQFPECICEKIVAEWAAEYSPLN